MWCSWNLHIRSVNLLTYNTLVPSSNFRNVLLTHIIIFIVTIEYIIYIFTFLLTEFSIRLLSFNRLLSFCFFDSFPCFLDFVFNCFKFCLFDGMLFFLFPRMNIFIVCWLYCFLWWVLWSDSFRSFFSNWGIFPYEKSRLVNILIVDLIHLRLLTLKFFFQRLLFFQQELHHIWKIINLLILLY